MATIKEIAERAGVSIGTVDRVIHNRGRVSPETRALIQQLIDELDYKPNNVARGLAIMRKKLKFTFFIMDPSEHPFFEDVRRGAERKTEELAQYGVEVDIRTLGVNATDMGPSTLQTDGIAMIPLPQMEPLRQWARSNGIPTVYYNIPVEDDHCLAYVGCDYKKAGRIAAGLCAIACNGSGKVGILSEGNSSIDNDVISFQGRADGFRQELVTRYPRMRFTDCYVDAGPGLEETARQMLRDHPDLDMIYLINPGDYRVCKAIHEAAENVRIITNDLTEQQRPMVKDGTITATICQEPEQQGAQPLELLFQYLTTGAVPASRNCYTNLSIHINQTI